MNRLHSPVCIESPYHSVAMETTENTWPHGKALRNIRGALSMEKAARTLDPPMSRAAWESWETGKRRPSDESLKAIVEAFQCPPESIGYIPPEGWELVPREWLTVEFREIHEKLDKLIRRTPPR